jgi:lysophospholipase L1-like esterase
MILNMRRLCLVGVVLFLYIGAALHADCDSLPENHISHRVKTAYPFIKTELNRLDIFGEETWAPLFEKMGLMQLGSTHQLHIMHIGGSHVQAGILSNQIEKQLKNHFPYDRVGDKGFVFPYQLSNTNAPEGYKIKFTGKWEGCRSSVRHMNCNWGMSGINANTTSKYSSIWIRPEDHQKRNMPFCSVRIYCDLLNNTMTPEPYSLECPSHINIDTVAGMIEWIFENEQESLEFMLISKEEDSLANFTLQGFQFISEDGGVVMHPIGVNGASLNSYLKCGSFEPQLSMFKPDIAIFAIGVNDANVPSNEFIPEKFESQYDSLIGMFVRANPEVKLVFITNNDTYYKRRYANKNALKVKEVMYRLAEKHQGAVWNLFDIMGGLGSIQKWQLHGLAKKDRIHFTGAGYQLVGDLFVDALITRAQVYQTFKTAEP